MPEQTPDMFDLDPRLQQGFDTLTSEVGARTASRGADQAIRVARHRRTTIGAAAAVAVITVGGVIVSQLGHSQDRLLPAGQVPAPAVLDAAALNTITDGWVSGWHEAGKDDETVLSKADNLFSCLDSADSGSGSDADPKRFGTQLLVGSAGQIAYLAYADFGDDPSAATATAEGILPAFATCAGNSGVTDSYGRASVTSYDLPVKGSESTETAWVARLDNRLSFSMVLADGRQTAVQRAEIGAALLGALQVDESYRVSDAMRIDESSGSASSYVSSAGASPVPHPAGIDKDALASALDGWSTTWAAAGKAAPAELPCLSTSPGKALSGSAGSVGTTGQLAFHDFATAEDAAQGEAQLLAHLAACDNGPWNIDSTTIPGAVVAAHPNGTVWVTQQGRSVAVFTLAEATDPPPSVKLAVGKLVVASLT